MRLSALNIWGSFAARRAQQEQEVRDNGNHPKTVWDITKHRGWGNSINIWDWETLRFQGHTTPLPREGDELLIPMKSGKTARLRFTKVEPCYDPSDMWFATAAGIGYVEDKE